MIAKGQVALAMTGSDEVGPGEGEDEEKTTIEAAWEEEASTTIEQGEIAAKLRALGSEGSEPPAIARPITNVTSTNSLEEPTMDDQRANAALANIPVLTPSELVTPITAAKLVCTSGNDAGREYELRTGKSYSIGRGLDNDIVLTDISVSRKHFDLRLDNGSWVLADRGSGNGTLVNGSIEDTPFLLASGDRIEIGNTVFRFDLPGAPVAIPRPPRAASYEVDLAGDAPAVARTHDDDDDEEEPSTVAGRPLREVAPEPAPERAYVPPGRPKTLPPPNPARLRTANPHPANAMTMQPHAGMPALPLPPPMPPGPAPAIIAPLPQSTMPMPQMANRPPPVAAMLSEGFIPSTLPGQAPPAPRSPSPFLYASSAPVPNHATELVPHAAAPPAPLGQNIHSITDEASTPIVTNSYERPVDYPYDRPLVPAPRRSASRNIKLMIGGAALTLFAAAATILIIRHTASSALDDGAAALTPAPPTPKSQPRVQPLLPAPPPAPPMPPPTPTPPLPPAPQHAIAPVPTPAPVAPTPPPPVHVAVPTPAPQPIASHITPNPVAPPPPTQPSPPPHAGPSVDELRSHAAALYRQRNFNTAAQSLRDGYKNMSPTERKNLPSLAKYYEYVGNGFANANAASAADAFTALNSAIAADRNLEGAYVGELEPKLQQLAAKAALAFATRNQLESALSAVHVAESAGLGLQTVGYARQKLDQKASELYAKAVKDQDTNPREAKGLARKILGFVDAKSSWYAKAQALLNT